MNNIKTYTTWHASVTETETAIATEAPVAAQQTISTDVDTIINSLETLANELTEELNSIDTESIDEADGPGFISQWITSMKASASQKKVNKIRINALDLEFASKTAEGPKKDSMKVKSEQVNNQADELQKMVDDKFKGKGEIVDRRISSTKIQGKLELIKRQSGMEDDPSRKSDLKTKMKELADKYKEEQEAIAVLKDDNKDAIEAEKEKQRIKDEAETEKPEAETEKPETEKPETEKPETEKPEAETEKPEAETEKPEKKDADGADDATKADREKKNSKEGMIDRYKELLKKAQDDGDEEKTKTIQSKIDAISAKESWQIDGTELGRMFEMELVKYENSSILNESKYLNLTVKERFSRLL